MFATLARVLTGFILACLTAGLVQVLFIMTPAQLLQLPSSAFQERAAQAGTLSLLAATHAAIFSIAFTLIAAGIGEWMRVRAPAYYIATGAIIAALGFSAQYASEVAGQPTIFNSYAIAAFITSGALAGFVYWLAAGRYAGGRHGSESADEYDVITSDQSAPDAPRTWRNRPRIVVEDPIAPGSVANKKATLAERIAEREERRAAEDAAAMTADKPVAKPSSPPATPPASQTAASAATDTSSASDVNEISLLPPKKS